MRYAIWALGLGFVVGCGSADDVSSDGGSDGGTGGSITLSGTLVVGAQPVVPPPPMPSQTPPSPPPGDPLVGYQLYCVTFATPPTATAATADATGTVTLDLEASGVAFGCFVLDETDEAVATLVFTNGAERGQTITLTGDTDLGSITVDAENGIALTELNSADALTGSEDLTCPLGTWVTTVPREDCTGTATATVWIAQVDAGQYTISYTIGPLQLADTGECGYRSEAGIPATESGGSLMFSIQDDPTCAVIFRDMVVTPNGDCTEITLDSTIEGCVSCDGGQCGCGGGTETCTASYTATRQ